MKGLAVWLDDFALRALPGVEVGLARERALVMRSFSRLPNPATVGQLLQYRQVAVLGGVDFNDVVHRIELATTSLRIGVIGVVPPGPRRRGCAAPAWSTSFPRAPRRRRGASR